MDFHNVVDWIKDHKATIGSGFAVAGVFATSYFSGKAAVRVHTTVDPDMDKVEKLKEYIRAYWKTVLAGGITCALIISSDRIHVKNEVALAGAAAMFKDKYADIKKKLINEVGLERAQEIENEAVQEAVIGDVNDNHVDVPPRDGNNDLLIYEPYTKQLIWTTEHKITQALLEANKKLCTSFEVYLNTIIKAIGGEEKPLGEELGWSWDNEVQDYNWSYTGGPWIELIPAVYKTVNGEKIRALVYLVDPETQRPEDMIYYGD